MRQGTAIAIIFEAILVLVESESERQHNPEKVPKGQHRKGPSLSARVHHESQ